MNSTLRAVALIGAASVFLFNANTRAAGLRARVFDSASLLGLRGAVVTLDLLPADGTPEFTTSADTFGFVAITNIPPGDYRLRATHPGYSPGQQDETFSTTNLMRNLPLPRVPGDPTRFDIFLSVACVKSGLLLDGVPVRVDRYAGAADLTPEETIPLITDANGLATLAGARIGHYIFSINDPVNGGARTKWEFTNTMRRELRAPHAAQALLKPIGQDMTIRVRGFDPRLGPVGTSNQPLAGVHVELTGVHPNNVSDVLLPPRVGITDTAGDAKFQDLPAIAWRAVARRFGYTPTTNFIVPNFSGTLAALTEVTLNPLFSPFGVTMDSAYLNPTLLTGLVVRVEGLTNSSTEGITREFTTMLVDPPGPPPPFSGTVVPGLIAGRYDVTVTGLVHSAAIKSGAFVTTGKFSAVFSGAQIVELTPGVASFIPFFVQAEPARVRVRLHKADAMSDFPVASATGALTNRPAYARGSTPLLVFKESAVTNQLKPEFRVAMFDTDDSGEAFVNVPPGVHGLEAPLLAEYFGSEARLRDVTTGEEIAHGWPFAANPDAGGFPLSPHHALGLRLSSGHEYELDLYARKKLYDVRGEVKPDALDVVAQRIAAVSGTAYIATRHTELIEGGSATLAGHPPSKPLSSTFEIVTNSAAVAPNAQFLFEDVEPGTRSLSISHPRNTFSAPGGGPTFSVVLPDWGPPGIVDGGDAADAATGVFPLETVRLQRAGATPLFEATTLSALDTVRVRFHRWNTNAGGFYALDSELTSPQYFIPDPEPGSILSRHGSATRFKMGARSWDLYFAFNPTNWFRLALTATNTGYEFVRDAYFLGPSNSVITPLIETYSLSVRAENEADPAQEITGVSVTLSGGGSRTAPYTTNDYSGPVTPTAATHATWFYTGQSALTATSPKDFLLTLKMRRGMGVGGLALDATNSQPVSNALVRLYSRFGTLLLTTNTATNGAYTFAALSNAQPVFVDLTVPGYVQHRTRHAPTFSAPDYSGTNLLVPIQQPKILTNELDRFGMFLPRVQRAGNHASYTNLTATGPLTLTWRMVAEEHNFTLELPEFDGAGGGTRGLFAPVTDTISETWLVDPRGFAGNPYQSIGTNLALPPATNAPAIRAWLKDVLERKHGHVFTRRIAGRAPLPPPGTNVEARATVPLWELPPGEFRPVVVTVTKRGSAAWRQIETNDVAKILRGEPLPPWMAFSADLIGAIAGLQAASGVDVTSEQVERFFPNGRFSALPKFTANISEDGGFVSYDYALDVSMKEGQDTPRAGLFAFAPRTLGLEFGAGVQFGMSGLSNRFSLGLGANVSAKTNLNRLLPTGLQKLTEIEGGFNVVAGITAAQSYDLARLSLIEISDYVGGSVELSVDFNLRPFTSKIPVAGPILLGLDQGNALRMSATLEGGVGLVASNVWRTEFPGPDFTGSVDPLAQNARRHFLGGSEFTTATTTFNPCVRFAVGGKITALGDRVTGTATIALQGNPCAGLDALLLTTNPSNDWRRILRVQGVCNLRADLKIDYTLLEQNLELFNKDLFPIDHQFGTESVFHLVEFSDLRAALVPASGLLSAYVPQGPDRVKNVFRPGRGAAAAGGLAWTEVVGGDMVLRLAGTDCASNEPMHVATAPGLLDVAFTRLPSGQWLAAWSEISAADIGNAYAPSVVKYSLSGINCTNWSVPAVIATLPDLATDLRLVVSGSFTGLVWLHGAEGPLSLRRGVSGATWHGGSWSSVSELLVPQDIADFDAEANAATALLAWTDGTGAAHSLSWNGASISGPHIVGTNAEPALDLAVNSAGEFHLAWNSSGGGVNLSRFNGVSAWTLLGTPATNTLVSELALAPLVSGGSNLWLLAWLDAADATALHYAVASATGAALRTNTPAAFAGTGRYTRLSLVSDGGPTARLHARHTGTNNVTDLRELVVTPAGIVPWLLDAQPLSGGGLRFDLHASPQQSYRLQSSSNLVDWLDALLLTPTNSPVRVEDYTPAPFRFYRAVSP